MSITCPKCRGVGYLSGIVEYAERSRSGPARIRCTECGGEGVVTEERAHYFTTCAALLDAVNARDMSIPSAARHLGIERRAFGDMVFGRAQLSAVQGALAQIEEIPIPTDAQKAERQAAIDSVKTSLKDGLSPCCKLPLDTSRTIKNGRYAGHGPKYCPGCKREVCRQ